MSRINIYVPIFFCRPSLYQNVHLIHAIVLSPPYKMYHRRHSKVSSFHQPTGATITMSEDLQYPPIQSHLMLHPKPVPYPPPKLMYKRAIEEKLNYLHEIFTSFFIDWFLNSRNAVVLFSKNPKNQLLQTFSKLSFISWKSDLFLFNSLLIESINWLIHYIFECCTGKINFSA